MAQGPTSPEALLAAFVAALKSNDADAIAELYDENAVFIFSALNFDCRDRDEIRAAYKGLFDLRRFDIAIDGERNAYHAFLMSRRSRVERPCF